MGSILLLLGAVWLGRQAVAEWLAQAYCSGQKLECSLKIARLGFGGVAVRDLDVRAAGGEQPAILARRLDVDIAWDFPAGVRARAIRGDEVDLRLDLTGSRGVLGDLDEFVQRLTSNREPSTAPAPSLEFTNLRVVGDTLWGPVEASGQFLSDGSGGLDLELVAPPVHLVRGEEELEFDGAAVTAKLAGGEMTGGMRFDLTRMRARGANVDDAKIELDLNQVGGRLVGGESRVSARRVCQRGMSRGRRRGWSCWRTRSTCRT